MPRRARRVLHRTRSFRDTCIYGKGVARNRGRFATLRGIHRGQTVCLPNPSNGRQEDGRVIATGAYPYNRVPWVRVRFGNGAQELYAAEYLQLRRQPARVRRAQERRIAREVHCAIRERFGVSGQALRTVVLEGRYRRPRDRGRCLARGPFLRKFDERLDPGELVLGFYSTGRTFYVNAHYAAYDYLTRVHEELHARSKPFYNQMTCRGFRSALEGITDYLAFQAATPRFGVRDEPRNEYRAYVRFVGDVARAVGTDRLAQLYFGKGRGLADTLIREVDAAVGRPGAFKRAARRLGKRGRPIRLLT